MPGGRRAVAAAVLAGAICTGSPAAQQPPIFRTSVEYVEVDAIVTDEQDRFVRDLKEEDSGVTEDGRRQTLTAFTLVDIPVTRDDRALYSSDPIEPDVSSCRPEGTRCGSPRGTPRPAPWDR